MKVTAENFYESFVEKVREDVVTNDGTKLSYLYSHCLRAYTKYINKNAVPEILNGMGLETQNEYFNIDTIGWTRSEEKCDKLREEAKELKLNEANPWDLVAAIEHENDKTGWIYEVIKLAHIKCPLKVVIGYTPCDRRDYDVRKAEFAYKCLKEVNTFKDDADEEFLLILGNAAPENRSSPLYEYFDFRGYILGKKIVKL